MEWPKKADVQKWWERAATGLAIVGLIDLTKQIVEWAATIHWIVSRYRMIRDYLFGWLPFHVPEQYRTMILLFALFFSIANIGYFRRRGRYLVLAAFDLVVSFLAMTVYSIASKLPPRLSRHLPLQRLDEIWGDERGDLVDDLVAALNAVRCMPFFDGRPRLREATTMAPFTLIVLIGVGIGFFLPVPGASFGLGVFEGLALSMMGACVLIGMIIAWRWILTVGSLFLAILAVNEIYLIASGLG